MPLDPGLRELLRRVFFLIVGYDGLLMINDVLYDDENGY